MTWTLKQWDNIVFWVESRFGLRPDIKGCTNVHWKADRRPGRSPIHRINSYGIDDIMKKIRTERIFVNGNINNPNYIEDVLMYLKHQENILPTRSPDLKAIKWAWDMLQKRVLEDLNGATTNCWVAIRFAEMLFIVIVTG